MENPYAADIQTILSKRHDLGWDYWTTPDRRLSKGSPFSALDCAGLLAELGMDPGEPPLREVADLIFAAQREDGRFRLSPEGAVYPCHTIHAAAVLGRLGHAADPRMQKTFAHLLDTQYGDGGWRCNKFSYGRGPETEFSNPGPTLTALDAFRMAGYCNREPALDRAAEFLLAHWTTRLPLGPCHYGIGTLFMQVTYPFSQYNLFYYVYVLSFYGKAKTDPRFLDALAALQSKLSEGGVAVERPHQKLAGFSFCKKGAVSPLATARYREILRNLGQ